MSDPRKLQMLQLATLVSLLLALVNHLLPPKAFSATQMLFDYEFGLTRRGLFGEVFSWITGTSVSVSEVYAAAAVLALIGALAFYLFLSRQLPQQVSSYLLLILGLNSFAFASFVGNTGYLDALLLAVTLLALASDGRSTVGLSLRLGLVVIGVMIHENMLPYFTVLIGFDLWLARRDTRLGWLVALSPVLVGGLTIAALAGLGTFSTQQAADYAQYLQSRADFKLDPNSTDVAGRTIGQNFALMAELRGTTKYWAWVLFDGIPLLAMSLWLSWLAARLLGAVDVAGKVMMVGAVLAPISLNFIAFDVVRFGAASVLCGFLVLVLLVRHLPDAAQRLEQSLSWPVFVVLLVLNANMFTIEVNVGAGHVSQFPWVLLTQLQWFGN